MEDIAKRRAWQEVTGELVEVAMGRRAADLVIRNGRWLNVSSGEIIPGTDIAIVSSRIAYCGPDAGYCIGPETKVIAADGRYLVPGLLDAHTHIEVAMITATEYARAVIPHGTTGLFIDPHEIANVLGLAGMQMMMDEIATLPIVMYVQVPSGVPSVPGLETSGAVLGAAEIAEALSWPGVIGLAELMNFGGVAANERAAHALIQETMKAGKVVGGHYASPDLGKPFSAYVAAGAADDHEGTREVDAIERVRRGMRAALRLGSTWYDVAPQITAVTEKGLDPRHFLLCTDGMLPETLITEGHMDRVVRHAIALGVPPLQAVQMATLNTAEHFGVDRDVGSIAPGRLADILIVSDLEAFVVDVVLGAGVVLAEEGQLAVELPPYRGYPAAAHHTVHLPAIPGKEAFLLAAPADAQATVRAHVIGIAPQTAVTSHRRANLPVVDGWVRADPIQDIAHAALVPRHKGTGKVTNTFVQGFGLEAGCAIASTVAHDSHHMIVVGTSPDEMVLATRALAAVGGGLVVYRDGKQLARVELPIAGLMSPETAEDVAKALAALEAAFSTCGCRTKYAYKQLSMLALVSIPELRVSDLGLVDVERFALIDPLDPSAAKA